jgi:hypothetical protein
MEDLIANQKKKTLAVSVLCRKIEREGEREGIKIGKLDPLFAITICKWLLKRQTFCLKVIFV